MTRADMPTLIGFTEAIERTGPVLFGDDWIGKLTQNEIALVRTHGPRRGRGADGSIAPCPPKHRPALDRALGRELRANAQRGTVVDWLHDHGFIRVTSLVCDAVALSRALGRLRSAKGGAANGKGPGPGRPADKTLAAVAKMLAVLKDKRLAFSVFRDMSDKEICEVFDIGRAVARSARKLVVSEFSKPTR
jgi:hypothetical protein